MTSTFRRLCALTLIGGSLAALSPEAHAMGDTAKKAPDAQYRARVMPTRLPGPAFPQFDSAAQVSKACNTGLQRAKAHVAALERRQADSTWLAAFDDLNNLTEDAFYPISFQGQVHPNKSVRDAAQACEALWQDFSSSLGQNERVYRRLKAAPVKDAIDKQFRRLSLEFFEDYGVSLPKAMRERAKVISDRMNALAIDFEKNIREAGIKVAFRESELKGLPEDVLKRAQRDTAGMLLLGLDNPSYSPVMELAEDGTSRERMWRAKQSEGGAANLKLLSELVTLRKDYAALFGFDNYADFVLRRRMAQDARRAHRFLDELKSVIEDAERREIAQLRDAKASHLGQPDAKLERWDLMFYSERVKRERYSVDQNQFRAYFPPQESLKFVMGIAERMFGVRFTQVEGRFWHPEVQGYAVLDAATRKPLAGLMVDLYPREGKYNHAAVWALRGSATRGRGRLPQAALVVNFDRQGLSLEELETLLHEFGHALHNNLSATRYSSLAGTSTPLDFVEAPSQMLEDWVYDPKVMATFSAVCPACKPVPKELLEAAATAHDYGKATRYSRQHLYASYDLALHGPKEADPMTTWAGMEGATPLGHVPGTLFPAGFAHVVGGYAAGYYGYLWSEVVARDMRTAFAADRLSAVTGARYRTAVLAQGGQQPPADLVTRFLGRESNAEAFYNHLKKP